MANKIAVALLTRDVEPWRLQQALKSRIEQTRKPDEVIVVDENSDNQHKSMYQQVFSEFKEKIKFFECRINDEYWFHPAQLCNVALANTDCDYIVFGGVDEILSANALEELEKEIKQYDNALFVSERLDLPKESNNLRIDFVKDFDKWAKKGKQVYAPGSFQVIPVEWAKSVGGFDESMKGWGFYDSEIISRAKMAKRDVISLEHKIKVLHIWHESYKEEGYKDESIIMGNKDTRTKTEDAEKIVVNPGIDWDKLRARPLLEKTPMQLRNDWEQAGSEKHFMNAIATGTKSEAEFEESGATYTKRVLEEIAKDGVDITNKRIVEIGCGAGRMTAFLARHAQFVYATDVSMEMLKRFRERLGTQPNVVLLRAHDLACIPDEEVDVIFSLLVFQHNPEGLVWKFFDDGHRILKPGGHYVFQLSTRDRHEVVHSESRATDMVRWEKGELEEIAKRFGFDILNPLDSDFKVWQKHK